MSLLIKELFELYKRVYVFFCAAGLLRKCSSLIQFNLQGGSNMTGTDLCVNKPHCAAAVRP